MWKVKMISLTLVAALMFTACGNKDTGSAGAEVLLYEGEVSGSAIDVMSEQYETTTVRKEDYQESYYDTAELEYTDVETLYIDEEDAVLDAIKVKKGQRIKKGDVLAVFHLETSKTKLKKQKLQNDQARANYESGLSNLNSNLSRVQEEYSHMTNKAEKKVKALEIKKMKKEIEAYKSGEKEILEMEKEYNKLVRMQSKTNLVAKKSGVVTEVGRNYVGEEVEASSKIIEFRNNDEWIICVKDPESKLRYNMDVSVRLGKNQKDYQHEIKGKVITASDITGVEETDEEGENIVYIGIREADKKKYNFEKTNIYVHAVSFEIKDALMVGMEAVYTESVGHENKFFVWVVEDGSLHKRFIVSNYQNEKDYMIEQGVSEGQTLAIVE